MRLRSAYEALDGSFGMLAVDLGRYFLCRM